MWWYKQYIKSEGFRFLISHCVLMMTFLNAIFSSPFSIYLDVGCLYDIKIDTSISEKIKKL